MILSLILLKPIIRFFYMHSQDFRIAIVMAKDTWRNQ